MAPVRLARVEDRFGNFLEAGFVGQHSCDFVACGGEQGARDAGKMRQEGKDYVVEDGDILLVRFNL